MIKVPGCSRAPYVGHKGWITIDTTVFDDWADIRDMIDESYRLIAPKACIQMLDATSVNPKPKPKLSAKQKTKSKATSR
jgi:hypothetical protein